MLDPPLLLEWLRKLSKVGPPLWLTGREQLKRYFAGPKIRPEVDENGNYVAHWGLVPAIFLGETQNAAPGGSQERRFYVGGSGGAKPEYPETRIRIKGFIRRL